MSIKGRNLLTANQAAERLGITVKALRQLMGNRLIPFVKISARRTRLTESDVETYIKEHRVEAYSRR